MRSHAVPSGSAGSRHGASRCAAASMDARGQSGPTAPMPIVMTPASHTPAAAACSRGRRPAAHSVHQAATTATASQRGGGDSVQAVHGARSTRLALSTMLDAARRATTAGTIASAGCTAAPASRINPAPCTTVINGTAAKLRTRPASVAWPNA